MPWLFAEDPMYMQMGQRFRTQRSSDATFELVLALVLVVVAGIVAFLVYHHRERRKRLAQTCPQALFRQLCHAHGLNWNDRSLLGRLAKAQQLDQPAVLFVEPRCFEVNPNGTLTETQTRRLQEIRQRLFRRPARR